MGAKEIRFKNEFGKSHLTTGCVSSLLLDVSTLQEDLTLKVWNFPLIHAARCSSMPKVGFASLCPSLESNKSEDQVNAENRLPICRGLDGFHSKTFTTKPWFQPSRFSPGKRRIRGMGPIPTEIPNTRCTAYRNMVIYELSSRKVTTHDDLYQQC